MRTDAVLPATLTSTWAGSTKSLQVIKAIVWSPTAHFKSARTITSALDPETRYNWSQIS